MKYNTKILRIILLGFTISPASVFAPGPPSRPPSPPPKGPTSVSVPRLLPGAWGFNGWAPPKEASCSRGKAVRRTYLEVQVGNSLVNPIYYMDGAKCMEYTNAVGFVVHYFTGVHCHTRTEVDKWVRRRDIRATAVGICCTGKITTNEKSRAWREIFSSNSKEGVRIAVEYVKKYHESKKMTAMGMFEFLRALHLGTHPLRRNGDDIAGTCKVLFAAMSDTQKMDIIINYITHPPRNSPFVVTFMDNAYREYRNDLSASIIATYLKAKGRKCSVNEGIDVLREKLDDCMADIT